MVKDILTIVLSRGRPESLWGLYGSLRDTKSRCPVVIVCDDDDETVPQYQGIISRINDPMICLDMFDNRGGRSCQVLNKAALKYSALYPVVGYFGDDTRPRTLRWDDTLARQDWSTPAIHYCNDLYQCERLPTHVWMRSDIIQTLGYYAPPCLEHLFVDNAWQEWGRQCGMLHYHKDVIVEHCHPHAGKNDMDNGYETCNNNAQWDRDKRAWEQYKQYTLPGDIQKLSTIWH